LQRELAILSPGGDRRKPFLQREVQKQPPNNCADHLIFVVFRPPNEITNPGRRDVHIPATEPDYLKLNGRWSESLDRDIVAEDFAFEGDKEE
jgi:hypothetical protein